MLVKQLQAVLVLALSVLATRAARGQGEFSCCDESLTVGFSEDAIKDGPLFEGIVGLGELCTADQGEVISTAFLGEVSSKRLYVDIVSNLLEGEQVLGWSYGLHLQGAALATAATVAGTSADTFPNGGYRDPEGSFNKTQVIDPAKNAGQRGIASAVALTTQGNPAAVLPSRGTQSVLAMDLQAEAPQGAVDQVASLRFVPISWFDNVIVVNGNSALVCNFDLSRLTVVFRAGPPRFYRGDANGDARVDIADPVWILNELFLGGPASPCADAADANDDGLENATDTILLIDYIFLGSHAPPPAPGSQACGPDPTEDLLDCSGGLTGCS